MSVVIIREVGLTKVENAEVIGADVKTDVEKNIGADVEGLVTEKPKTEMQLLKEKAVSLGLEFNGNISKADLTVLVEEAEAK